jgi:hypothetical protein
MEGLGGWILVNLGFGVLSLIGGSIAETWVPRYVHICIKT